jgi:hypothetical protein
MYGMVTNLNGPATGTPASQGWRPEKQEKHQAKGLYAFRYLDFFIRQLR